jgi:hypothetical protein
MDVVSEDTVKAAVEEERRVESAVTHSDSGASLTVAIRVISGFTTVSSDWSRCPCILALRRDHTTQSPAVEQQRRFSCSESSRRGCGRPNILGRCDAQQLV